MAIPVQNRNESKVKRQRKPKKYWLVVASWPFLIVGLIGLFVPPIGAILLAIWAIILITMLSVKTDAVSCPSCKVPNKVESKVKYFNCRQCGHTINRESDA